MRFEGTLARRYIFSQKRHSLLTVCSITIAVAMMAMIFILVQTMFASERTHIINTEMPFHTVLLSEKVIPESLLDELRASPAIADCGYFEPDQYYTPEKPGRYVEYSPMKSVYNYYLAYKKYSEEELAALSDPGSAESRELRMQSGSSVIRVPEKGAKPVYINYAFRLKEGMMEPYSVVTDAINNAGLSGEIHQLRNDELIIFDYIGMDGKFSMAMMFTLVFVLVVLFAMALRMVIDTAFEISSRERERQFGVLQSIGATKKQIVRIITREGLQLSVIGVPLGLCLGIGFAYLTYRVVLSTKVIYWTWGEHGMDDVIFKVGAGGLITAAITGLGWVLLSAYGTGLRMVKKKAPIEAVRASQSKIRKVKKHSVFGLLFGWVGALAARNVRRSKKRYVVTILSLAVSVTLVATVSYAADSYRRIATAAVSEFGAVTGVECQMMIEGYADSIGKDAGKQLEKELSDTGYFKSARVLYGVYGGEKLSRVDNPEDIPEAAKAQADENYSLPEMGGMYYFIYLNEEDYNNYFDGEPQISYQELTQSRRYVLITGKQLPAPETLPIHDNRLTVALSAIVPLSDERRAEKVAEWEAQQEEKRKAAEAEGEEYEPEADGPHFFTSFVGWDAEKKQPIEADGEIVNKAFTAEIAGQQSKKSTLFTEYGITFLVSTVDVYMENEMLTSLQHAEYTFALDFKDDDSYSAALEWIKTHPRYQYEEHEDYYSMVRQIETGTAAVDLTIRVLSLLISMIAAVSMINVISTGILNRRSELAGMQSVGMTRRQQLGLVLCECVQFVIGGIVLALVFTMGAVFAMRKLVNAVGLPELADQLGLTYTKPLPVIGIAAVCAFAVAVIAALLPLGRMQREPIVESLRGFD